MLAKIQARMIKSMLHLDEGIEGGEAIKTRLVLEGFDFEAKTNNDGLKIFIKRCPWHELW